MQTLALTDFLETGKTDMGLQYVLKFIPDMGPRGPWVVGGTIRRVLAQEELTTDYDIMFRNLTQFETFCSEMRERGYEVAYESSHQITFDVHGWEVQAIKAVFNNTLIQTLNGFDFTLCQFGYDGTNLVWGNTAVDDVQSKALVFTHTGDPIATMRRMFKYASQGFFMDNKNIAKFLNSVAKKPAELKKAEVKWDSIIASDFDIKSFEGSIVNEEVRKEIERRMKQAILGAVYGDSKIFARGGVVKGPVINFNSVRAWSGYARP